MFRHCYSSSAPALGLLLGSAFFLPGGAVLAQEEVRSTLVPEIVGPSETSPDGTVQQAKQIEVISDDPRLRSAFSNFSDGLQKDFRQLLGESDETWRSPLEIHVSGAPQDVVTGATAVIPREITLLPDGSFQLQLFVRMHNRYDQEEVTRRFIQLMLYEIMVRPYVGKPDSFNGKRLAAPFWLVRGLEELLEYRASGRPSDLYAGIVNSREVLPVAEILGQKSDVVSDPVTDAIFGASSAALVAALLDQDSGPDNLKSYLAALTEPEKNGPAPPDAELRRHFPGLRGSPGALEKWWTLQIASMGQLQVFEYLNAEQTEIMLDQALMVTIAPDPPKEPGRIRKLLPQPKPDPPFTGRINDFEKFLDYENAKSQLEECQLQLKKLALNAFPVYQGLILRYEIAVANLIKGQTRGLAKELEKLDRERANIKQAMSRVTDYMNYFEATQAEGRSEAYDSYREMKDKLERQGDLPRDDRISRYLDALEKEFESP